MWRCPVSAVWPTEHCEHGNRDESHKQVVECGIEDPLRAEQENLSALGGSL